MAENDYLIKIVECACQNKHELLIKFDSTIATALDASDKQELSYQCPDPKMKDNPDQVIEIAFTESENPHNYAATVYKVRNII